MALDSKIGLKKVYFGITKPNMGGAQRYVLDMARNAHSRGLEVKVISGVPFEGEAPLLIKLESEGIPVVRLPGLGRNLSPLQDVRSFLSLWRILETEEPDVFHINSSKMGGLGALAARLARIKKIIFTAHGFAFNEDRPEYQKLIIKFFVWITILLSHKTICVSDKLKRDIEHMPGVKKKLVVIKNGIEEFQVLPRHEARERLVPGMKNSTKLIGTLSELHHVKGLDIAIRGFSEIKDEDALLVILGEGEEHLSLENLIESLELQNKVFLKGYTPEARQYLPGLDIFTLTSRSEGLPYSLLEAGNMGLPVVATRVGGIPEVIESGVNGILIPPEDSPALYVALKSLLKDKEKRETLGKNLENSIKKFSTENMVTQTLKLY
ncbi:glycosyltransferase [Candidatus Parcubacteria bacterium]|nr:glycosyltransferase [Candidatus Parcubacteria bacterium]